MADSKITVLTAITTVDPAVDVLPIVDVSDTTMAASGTTKKITSNQILGAGGTATLASATITGDLTVDTSVLKVDSANNRVGIITATPNDFLEVVGSGANGIRVSRSGQPTQYSTLSAGATGPTLDVSSAIGSLSFGIGGANQMTLNSTGLGVGVTPAGTGGCLQLKSGITFPATQVASSDANTLDDYVESTFSPTIIGSTTAGSATYSTQIGRATKVGRLVTFQLRVAYSAGTGTGNLRVDGLPFTAGLGSVFTIYAENIALTASNYAVASLSSGNTFISVDQLPVGGGAAAAVPYDAAGDIQISGSYIV